ncbi:MAG: hypothetical protein IPI30_21605 [Saprospiraceae bacterium]|nr:hypothetical protein [Candidatus Vicinibacter affinis]
MDILQWAVYDRNGARVFDSKYGLAQWDGNILRGMHVVEGYVVVSNISIRTKGKGNI